MNKDAMRARHPAVAEIVDELRAAGLSIAAVRASDEGGRVEVGRALPDRVVPPVPGNPPGGWACISDVRR